MFDPYAFSIESVYHPAGIFSNFGQLATLIIGILTAFAGALTAIFIVIAGIKFVTSAGDEKKLASAKATITYAIIGIIVTALAFLILRVIQFFLKSNVPIT